MNPMIPYASTFGIISILIYASVNKQSIAKVMATFTLVFVLITFSSASTEWNQYTNGLVDDVDDPHYGLPDSWDDKQAVCFHFPEGYTPSNLDDGRHHFDSNGTDFKIDKNWNSTGGCVGGFEGYDYGLNLFNAAVEATNSTFTIILNFILDYRLILSLEFLLVQHILALQIPHQEHIGKCCTMEHILWLEFQILS